MSLSEENAEQPYASIFYTSNDGHITFFGLAVAGTLQTEEGQLLTYHSTTYNAELDQYETDTTTNPDEGDQTIRGTLHEGVMVLCGIGDKKVTLVDIEQATNFVSMIRMVYSMEAQSA